MRQYGELDTALSCNIGYGKISPRNCYAGGQSTNCKMNKIVLELFQQGKRVDLFFHKTENYKNVKPPNYLSKTQKKEFNEIADKLVNIGIMSELDEDCLARYLISKDNYLKFTKLLNIAFKNKTSKKNQDNIEIQKILSNEIECNLINQDRAFKQCRQCATDLGLTISSRCRLIVPSNNTKNIKENKFSKFLA